MADYPALPLWTDAYLADTDHLTLEEHGAYLRLLMLAWRTPGCALPRDPDWIARRLRITREDYDRAVAPIVGEFFTVRGKRLIQKRLQREFAYVSAKAEKQSTRAKSRWNKEKAACRGNAPTPTPTPTPTPIPINPSGGRLKPTLPEGKDPATPESASRVSAAPAGGRAGGAPPAQDKGTNNQPAAELPDWEHVMEDQFQNWGTLDVPFHPDEHGQWQLLNTDTYATIEDVYREHIRWIVGAWATECLGDGCAGLAKKLIATCGPKGATDIIGKAGQADDPRAYVVAAIKNAENGGRRPSRGKAKGRTGKRSVLDKMAELEAVGKGNDRANAKRE